MPRTIVFVHGHHFKPPQASLLEIWCEALRLGIGRDSPEKLELFDAANKEMAFYGDLTNAMLSAHGLSYDDAVDIADRYNAIARLREFDKVKKFKRYNYQQLPGKTAVPEIVADVAAPLLGKLGLAPTMVAKLIPELAAYWDGTADYPRETIARTRRVIGGAMQRGDEIMIIAHGLGAIVAYDALWELSRGGEGDDRMRSGKIHHFVTLGAPLGDETVKRRLAGSDQAGERRYPNNLLNWHNIAAEDDYYCHDKTVMDDFQPMLKRHLISAISDYRIYNLAIRFGRSNPHSVIGYLVHPRLTKLVTEWL